MYLLAHRPKARPKGLIPETMFVRVPGGRVLFALGVRGECAIRVANEGRVLPGFYPVDSERLL